MNKEIKIVVEKPELEKRDKNKIKELDDSVSSDFQSSFSDLKLKRDTSNNYSIMKSVDELPKYEK